MKPEQSKTRVHLKTSLGSNNFVIRAFSALVAVALVASLVWYWQTSALQVLCALGVILGTRELIRLLFEPTDSFFIKALFFGLTLATFVGAATSLVFSAAIFSLASLLFICVSLARVRAFPDLAALLRLQTKAILGFVYLGLLPGFAVQITYLPGGLSWFLAMLGIVFAGDTCAYLSGMLFGKNLLVPAISPKKTIEGAIGGLAGSLAGGFLFVQLVPDLPLGPVLLLSLLVGAAGQMGDLFESLLKRVANQKDSGHLMPGHGGLLDRIDGVLFAAPVLLAGAMIIELSLGRL